MALVERKGHRKILNLDEVAQRCRGLAPADGRALICTIISFDDISDFPALLRELQTIDILVWPCTSFLFPKTLTKLLSAIRRDFIEAY